MYPCSTRTHVPLLSNPTCTLDGGADRKPFMGCALQHLAECKPLIECCLSASGVWSCELVCVRAVGQYNHVLLLNNQAYICFCSIPLLNNPTCILDGGADRKPWSNCAHQHLAECEPCADCCLSSCRVRSCELVLVRKEDQYNRKGKYATAAYKKHLLSRWWFTLYF